jgi:hypothetical protein
MTKKIKLDYDFDNPDSIRNKTFWCPVHQRAGNTLLNCLKCSNYPCPALRVQDIKMLEKSPYVWQTDVKLEPRRKRLHILKKYDGSLIVDEKFDPKTAKEKDLKDIEEVYVVSKVLVKTTKLVPKEKK